MTIIRCPRCRDEVTAPAKASRQAVVRCPLCLEEYLLAEALRNSPPELIVIGSAADSGAAEAPAGDAVPDYQVAGGAFDSSPGTGMAAPVRPTVKGGRPRRQQGGVLGGFIGIVFGGIAGISLAVLLLWWVFKTDVGDIGPKVAKYAPWIVPAQFHGKPASSTPSGGTSQASANKTSANAPPNANVAKNNSRPGKNQNKKTKPADGSGELQMLPEPGGLPAAGNPLDVGGGLTLDPLSTKPASANLDVPGLDPLATPPITPPGPLPAVPGTLPAVPGPEVKPVDGGPDLTNLLPAGTPPAPPTPAPAAAKPPTGEDFTQAVIAAGDALVRYDSTAADDGEAKRARFTDMYVAFSDVGRVVSHLNVKDADLEGMVKELKSQLDKIAGVGGPSKTPAVRFLASTHWTERKAGEGLLAAGIVKEFKAAGSLFEITLDATRSAPLIIPVVSAENPQDFCQVEDELVVVGRIIDEPKTNLPGYEGAAPRVLLLGYCVKTPKAAAPTP